MARLFHWLAHKTGSNTGEVEVFWCGERLMVGFRCHGCGVLGHVSDTGTTRPSSATDGGISHTSSQGGK